MENKSLYIKGFTLIELLVVISIVSLLSSVVLSALNSSRDKARVAGGKQSNASIFHAVGDRAIAIWDFDDCPTSTVTDTSGNGNTGTLINSPSTSSDSPSGRGCSLSFNGTNQTVSVPANPILKPSSQITITAWVKPSTGLPATREVYRKNDGGSVVLLSFQDVGYCSGGAGTGGCLSFGLSVAGSYSELDVKINAGDWENKWSFLAVTYDGVKKRMYKDGVEIGSVSVSGAIDTANNAPAYIGSYLGSGEFFKGYIDEVHIYSASFLSSRIQKIFAEEKSGRELAQNSLQVPQF